MGIVSAGVHFAGITGCILQAGCLGDRERIHVCAQEQGRAWRSSPQGCNYTGFCHTGFEGDVQAGQCLADELCCFDFLESQFRVAVNQSSQPNNVRVELFC